MREHFHILFLLDEVVCVFENKYFFRFFDDWPKRSATVERLYTYFLLPWGCVFCQILLQRRWQGFVHKIMQNRMQGPPIGVFPDLVMFVFCLLFCL